MYILNSIHGNQFRDNKNGVHQNFVMRRAQKYFASRLCARRKANIHNDTFHQFAISLIARNCAMINPVANYVRPSTYRLNP